MSGSGEIPSIDCPECGWEIPTELVESLTKGQSIFCEKCGAECKSTDFNQLDLKKYLRDAVNVVRKEGGKLFKMLKNLRKK